MARCRSRSSISRCTTASRALGQASFREVSSQEGIPLELLLVVREAIGFAQADADDRMRDDELGVVPIIAMLLSSGLDPAVIERWLRVYGDALRRSTETESDWWKTEVELPLLEGGMAEAQMMEAQADLGSHMAP